MLWHGGALATARKSYTIESLVSLCRTETELQDAGRIQCITSAFYIPGIICPHPNPLPHREREPTPFSLREKGWG